MALSSRRAGIVFTQGHRLGNGGTHDGHLGLRCLADGLMLPKGVIVHSGRGSQYCSAIYQNLLAKHKLVCRKLRKAIVTITPPWKAGATASRLRQFVANGSSPEHRPSNRSSMTSKCHNRKRLHSKLGYLSPEVFTLKSVS